MCPHIPWLAGNPLTNDRMYRGFQAQVQMNQQYEYSRSGYREARQEAHIRGFHRPVVSAEKKSQFIFRFQLTISQSNVTIHYQEPLSQGFRPQSPNPWNS
jgi:hypothetical protein